VWLPGAYRRTDRHREEGKWHRSGSVTILQNLLTGERNVLDGGTTSDGSWKLWALVGLVVIWVAVILISLLAPDLVSGSEQEHLPLPLMTAWLWGIIGTGGFLWGMGKLRGKSQRRRIWAGLGIAVSAVWILATILAIALPVLETGSDPTQLPLAALVAPLGAAVLTFLAGTVAGVFAEEPAG
jgi:uncharacterized membrane protein